MPYYEGKLNRSIWFMNNKSSEECCNTFILAEPYIPSQYLSATKKGVHNPEGQVQIYIQNSKRGKDLGSLNNMENEVLYPINSEFHVINKVKHEDRYYYSFIGDIK